MLNGICTCTIIRLNRLSPCGLNEKKHLKIGTTLVCGLGVIIKVCELTLNVFLQPMTSR